MSIPSHLPKPRLCTLKKWPTYAGYGFNLHAEKGKPGQYVGKVDPNSPAETGGLGPKYFLVEVNGNNVEDLTHQNVVERIKEMPDRVTMLVAPNETYKYCKEHSIVISSDMPDVATYATPDAQPIADESSKQEEIIEVAKTAEVEQAAPPSPSPVPSIEVHRNSARSLTPPGSHAEADEVEYSVPDVQPSPQPSPAPSPEPQRKNASAAPSPPSPLPPSPAAAAASAAPPPPKPAAAPAAAPAATHNGGANATAGAKDPVANISLEEMRAKMGQNKRTQVKMTPTSFAEKSSMFQAL